MCVPLGSVQRRVSPGGLERCACNAENDGPNSSDASGAETTGGRSDDFKGGARPRPLGEAFWLVSCPCSTKTEIARSMRRERSKERSRGSNGRRAASYRNAGVEFPIVK